MSAYQCNVTFNSTGTFRSREISVIIAMVSEYLSVERWQIDDMPVPVHANSIERLIQDAKDESAETIGVTLIFHASSIHGPITCMSATGGDKWALNFVTVNFCDSRKVPDAAFLRALVAAVHPQQLELTDIDNDVRVTEAQGWVGKGARQPVRILEAFHYMEMAVVRQLGGLAHCLATPGYHVEPFCNGLLFIYGSGRYDDADPSDFEHQRLAMEHLGIW